ncbi:MAG: hypothetical protein NTW96_03680 [Planctomycetia bacterium]|nr:hypothetical protein [Planctomycetia bacterium]
MPRYIIEEDRAVWVREVYEVEANSPEEAEEARGNGDYEFLGFSLRDNVEFLDSTVVSCEQTDAPPWMGHPEDEYEPDEKPVIEAARELLDNMIDSGENHPELPSDDDEYPRDDDGNPWYSDCWKLYQAIEDYNATTAAQ